jgi:hypothetical protein
MFRLMTTPSDESFVAGLKAKFSDVEMEAHRIATELIWLQRPDKTNPEWQVIKAKEDFGADMAAACIIDALREGGFKLIREG